MRMLISILLTVIVSLILGAVAGSLITSHYDRALLARFQRGCISGK